jgi:eukaryotic-like serine/threonine-protein kinase
MPVRVVTKQASNVRLVELAGVVDETLDLADFKRLAGMPIVFDLGEVRRITSIGVRNWIDALRQLSGTEYYFVRCRPSVVWQFNMVLRFGGTGRIVSLFLPYTCSANCGHESEHLLDLRSEHSVVVAGQPRPQRCAKCGAVAEFDEDPASYFSHVAAAPPPRLPPAVAAVLDDAAPPPSTPLKITKEVTSDLTAVWLSGSIDETAKLKRIADGLDGEVLVVAQDVQSVSAEGLRRLVDALGAESSSVHLARAPLVLARVFAADREARSLPVVSIWLGLQCDTCSRIHWRDHDRTEWAMLRAGHRARCPDCEGSLVAFSEDAIMDCGLDLAPMPSVVATYLRHGRQEFPAPPRKRSNSIAQLHLEGYEILERLGVGGMAEVMLARQTGPQGFKRLVALKRILPVFVGDPMFVNMFLREARLAANISHANVVQIYDLRQAGSDFYIVMEYVPGWNLDVVLAAARRAEKPMPIQLACRIASDIAAGLHAAHMATSDSNQLLGVVHRDVSPQNVLVSKTGAVKLTDFGIAKVTDPGRDATPDPRRGKLPYMAPERFEGIDSDPRSDIYSTGLVLVVLLTQYHPYLGATERDTWENAVRANVAPPSTLRPDIPEELDAIAARALARDRTRRYQSAEDLHIALEQFLVRYGKPATASHLQSWLADLFASYEPSTSSSGDDVATAVVNRPG